MSTESTEPKPTAKGKKRKTKNELSAETIQESDEDNDGNKDRPPAPKRLKSGRFAKRVDISETDDTDPVLTGGHTSDTYVEPERAPPPQLSSTTASDIVSELPKSDDGVNDVGVDDLIAASDSDDGAFIPVKPDIEIEPFQHRRSPIVRRGLSDSDDDDVEARERNGRRRNVSLGEEQDWDYDTVGGAAFDRPSGLPGAKRRTRVAQLLAQVTNDQLLWLCDQVRLPGDEELDGFETLKDLSVDEFTALSERYPGPTKDSDVDMDGKSNDSEADNDSDAVDDDDAELAESPTQTATGTPVDLNPTPSLPPPSFSWI